MKRALFILIPFTILLSSCSREQPGEERLFDHSAPVFTCSFEANDTKVGVDNQYHLFWNENDMVSIFMRGLNEQYRFTGKNGDTGGTFEMVSAPTSTTGSPMPANYAVYPYYESTTSDYEGNISVIIPTIQRYTSDSFGLEANLMVAVTDGTNDYFLQFKNACGYLNIKLFGKGTVKRIVLEGNNNEPLSGNATIVASHSQLPKLTISEDGQKQIILDCGNGVTIGTNKEEAEDFWIVVPPIIFKNGFTITVVDVNDDEYVKSSTKEQVITRNICNRMSPVEINMASEATNVTSVSLDQSSLCFTSKGETIQLHAKVYPENASNQKVFWTSFDESIAVVDQEGNVTSVGEGETTITVTTEDGDFSASATAKIDWSAPALESLTITTPSSTSEVDVTEASQTIVFRAHLTDASGVERVTMNVFNTTSNGSVGKSSFAPEFALVSGDEKEGVYEATLILDADTRPGNYQCDLKVWDVLGNTPFLSNVVGRVSFTVINNNMDTDAPALESLTITTPSSTSEVDVTEASQTIVIRAHLTDASGVERVTMNVFNTTSNGSVGKSSFAPEFALVSGDEKDGVYEATLILDSDTRPGNYQCDLKVWDVLGNTPFLSNVVGRVSFTVINNAGDFDAPALEFLTITTPSSTSEVDVTEASQTIVFRAHLTDASGVERVTMNVFNTTSNGSVGKSSFAPEFALVSGDEKDGVYEATLILDSDTRPGNYQCDLMVWDVLGNTPFLLNVVGRVSFTVINNN